jgi:hypothetical protein
VFVTHLFELADSLHEKSQPQMLFLRAERGADGRRTFQIAEGAPLPTSYGGDTFRSVFGTALPLPTVRAASGEEPQQRDGRDGRTGADRGHRHRA